LVESTTVQHLWAGVTTKKLILDIFSIRPKVAAKIVHNVHNASDSHTVLHPMWVYCNAKVNGTLIVKFTQPFLHSQNYLSIGNSSQAPQSPTKNIGSPTKSPTKGSPRKKAGGRQKDVLQLPQPYCSLKSDQIKRWYKELSAGQVIGADNEAELEFFKMISFTNAFVLKVNQLSKQVCSKCTLLLIEC
jgi:hypothetical protein